MASPQEAIFALRKKFHDCGGKPESLGHYLRNHGQQGLIDRKFAGIDQDYGRAMIYRVDSWNQNNGIPLLEISELTVHPKARTASSISLSLHRRDIDVTFWDLKTVADTMELSTEFCYHYV